MKKTYAVLAVLALACAGCSLLPGGVEPVPVDKVLVTHRRALIKAVDQLFFEEFVKFKEQTSAFALFTLKEAELKVGTAQKASSKSETEFSIPVAAPLKEKALFEVSADSTGGLTLKYEPVAKDIKTYDAIKKLFVAASTEIYTLTDNGTDCRHRPLCFEIPYGAAGSKKYAYLADVAAFRQLQDQVAHAWLPPTPAAAPAP